MFQALRSDYSSLILAEAATRVSKPVSETTFQEKFKKMGWVPMWPGGRSVLIPVVEVKVFEASLPGFKS